MVTADARANPVSSPPPDWEDFLRSPCPAVIFGAGRQATIVHDFCLMFKKPVFCLMTSKDRVRWGFLPGEDSLPLYLAAEFPVDLDKGDFDLIVALGGAHRAEAAAMLRREGWPRVVTVDDWDAVNAATRKSFYDAYFTRKGARFITDGEGAVYMECPAPRGLFRIYYDIDPVYNAALLGVLNNIALPSVFGDFSCCSAVGPYERDPVTMRPGDTVFAVGACIGVFSCVAAYRGCAVHAFEPTPMAAEKYLRKNASLYDSVTVVPLAVLDARKTASLYVNEDYAHGLNISRHSILRHLEPEYAEIRVDATSLDAYVADAAVGRVDFIRSFSEYAEEYIFAGAGETMRRFAPRASYCCSDRAALRRIIAKANPDYQFADQGRQSFAWLPAHGQQRQDT